MAGVVLCSPPTESETPCIQSAKTVLIQHASLTVYLGSGSGVAAQGLVELSGQWEHYTQVGSSRTDACIQNVQLYSIVCELYSD